MRLKRVHALRFGTLEGFELGDLGPGLNVVLAPNEAGKSTLTALVRHVLYGFPDGRMRRALYLPPSGERRARLVFEDGSGEWALERVDGAKGGALTVRALRGAERPRLRDELCHGVDEGMYRVVFGFGLAELAEIDAGSESVVGRIYAASAGLRVDPVKLRAALRAEADALFRPRGTNKKLNKALSDMREAEEQVRGLERLAESFAEDRERQTTLAEELAPLADALREADAKARRLEGDAKRAAGLAEEAVALEDEVAALEDEVAGLERKLEGVVPDARVLEAEPELGVLLEDLSGFRAELRVLRDVEGELAEVERSLAANEAPTSADVSPKTEAELGRWRQELGKAENAVEQAESGVAGPSRPPVPLLPAFGALLLGAAGVLAGGMLRQSAALAVGVLALLLAAVWALAARGRGGVPGEAPLVSDRRARLDALRAEWRAWLAERGLDSQGDEVAAAEQVLKEAKERDALLAKRDSLAARVESERERGSAWLARLVAASAFLGEKGAHGLDDAEVLVARARTALEGAREKRDERRRLEGEVEKAREALTGAGRRLERLRGTAAQLLAAHGLPGTAAAGELEELARRAEQELLDAREEHERVKSEHDQLAGRLGTAQRDAAMTEARQGLESLRERARRLAEEHALVALAERLLGRAQERYDRERQPEVVREAAAVFGRMTGGRYVSVGRPLGSPSLTVVDAQGGSKPAEELSRGTAEQLYLALRVGLIGQLGDIGRDLPVLMDDVVVNFDPERRRGAAQAVAELARLRQVVFFTCHPETAAVLAEAVPDRVEVVLDERC